MRALRATAGLLGAVLLVANAGPKGDLDFTYVYPPQARAITPLRAWLDADAADRHARMLSAAASDHRDAVKGHRQFTGYEADYTWKVVADTPRFLSLSLKTYEFTAGANGVVRFDTLVWDKVAKTRRAPLSFFTDREAFVAAAQPAFCRRLDAERAEKREGTPNNWEPEFTRCLDPAAQTVILGSSTKARFDRIGVLIAQDEAGPHVEGEYDVTLPVTPALLAAVKPEWRRYFALGAP